MTPCWCGAPVPEVFRPGYGLCARCGTLVYLEPIEKAHYLRVGNDESGFYGREYWDRRVPEVYGLPTLTQRAREDLKERSLFALERILRFVAPGGSVLELGCAHGGLTYLMKRAGLTAEGLELSPWLIEKAEQLFGVKVFRGPLEACPFDRSFDAIVAIDLLEHLPDPLATLRACRQSLGKGGQIFLQTPCYRDDGADWEMFLPEEHLFLFTSDSVKDLLRQAGFASIQVEPSLFPYDMWITASETEIEPRSEPLADLPPELLALFELRAEFLSNQQELAEVREDQRLKLELIEKVDSELSEIRSDQDAKGKRIREDAMELARLRDELSSQHTQLLEGQELIETVQVANHALDERIGFLDEKIAGLRETQALQEQVVRRLDRELQNEAALRETASLRSLRLRRQLQVQTRARLQREKELESLSSSYEEQLQRGSRPLPGDLLK